VIDITGKCKDNNPGKFHQSVQMMEKCYENQVFTANIGHPGVGDCLQFASSGFSFSDLPGQNSGNKETDMAVAVNATINAVVVTQAAQPTPTPPPSPTLPLTPTLQPPPALADTLEPTRPPLKTPTRIGPWAGKITFASDIDSDNQPVNPGAVFKKGVTHIYATFPYSGIEQGAKVTFYWTVNGKEFVSAIHTWEWDLSGTHTTSTSYTNNRQLDAGNWTLTIFVNNKLLTSGNFKITP
jgi:hypothetical protein